jgi:hypothetical protein
MPLQDGASFVKLQHMGPPQAPHQEDDPHGVPVPPGLPKEVEFPKPVKEETPVRPRERWEIKPRRPRPPTDAERQRAMDKAIEFWTPNPHVMVALKPSQVYAGFSLVSVDPANINTNSYSDCASIRFLDSGAMAGVGLNNYKLQ